MSIHRLRERLIHHATASPRGRIRPPSRNGGAFNHDKVWRVLTRNFGWKLLSVGLAVLLWIAVEGEPELVTVQNAPVFYRNVEPSLALVAKSSSHGPGKVTRPLQRSGP